MQFRIPQPIPIRRPCSPERLQISASVSRIFGRTRPDTTVVGASPHTSCLQHVVVWCIPAYDDLDYEDERFEGDCECPCPFCNRTGSAALITEHFFEQHPVYDQKHALLFAIDAGTVLKSLDGNPFASEALKLGIEAHPIFSIELYETYFGSLEDAAKSAYAHTNDTDFDQPNERYIQHRKERLRRSVRATTDQQRRDYGPEWGETRLKILDRDNRQCRVCTAEADTTELHVHHITPAREFEDYDRMNEASNLVTLCPSCHGTFEGQFTDCAPNEFTLRARDRLQTQ